MGTAQIIHDRMQDAKPEIIAEQASSILRYMKLHTPQEQLLTLASAMIVLCDNYQLDTTNVMSAAHNLVYSGEYTNMHEAFSKLMKQRKMKWEL